MNTNDHTALASDAARQEQDAATEQLGVQLLNSTGVQAIDAAREYLTCFMRKHFKDKTFTRYIGERLAGDFAFEMAKALVMLEERAPASTLIQAVPIIERDPTGEWAHPDLPDFDEGDGDKYRAWLAAQGLTVHSSYLESEGPDHPAYVNYFERDDNSFREWLPARPEGEGWFTLAITDTEDGPAWMWARRVRTVATTEQVQG